MEAEKQVWGHIYPYISEYYSKFFVASSILVGVNFIHNFLKCLRNKERNLVKFWEEFDKILKKLWKKIYEIGEGILEIVGTSKIFVGEFSIDIW